MQNNNQNEKLDTIKELIYKGANPNQLISGNTSFIGNAITNAIMNSYINSLEFVITNGVVHNFKGTKNIPC